MQSPDQLAKHIDTRFDIAKQPTIASGVSCLVMSALPLGFMFGLMRLLGYHHLPVCHSFHMWISLLYFFWWNSWHIDILYYDSMPSPDLLAKHIDTIFYIAKQTTMPSGVSCLVMSALPFGFMFGIRRLLGYHHMPVCHSFHMWISMLYISWMKQLVYWHFVIWFHAQPK